MADISLIIDVQDQSVVKAVDRVNRLEGQYKKLDRAFNAGKLTAQQYAKGVQQIDARMDALRASTGKLSGSTNRFVKDMQRSAQAMNQFGVLADSNTVTLQFRYKAGQMLLLLSDSKVLSFLVSLDP